MEDLDVRLLVDLLRDRITPNRSLGQHFLLDEAAVSYTHLTLPTNREV